MSDISSKEETHKYCDELDPQSYREIFPDYNNNGDIDDDTNQYIC